MSECLNVKDSTGRMVHLDDRVAIHDPNSMNNGLVGIARHSDMIGDAVRVRVVSSLEAEAYFRDKGPEPESCWSSWVRPEFLTIVEPNSGVRVTRGGEA